MDKKNFKKNVFEKMATFPSKIPTTIVEIYAFLSQKQHKGFDKSGNRRIRRNNI